MYYRPQCSCDKVMFSQASVILSIGGVSQTFPWADTPYSPGRQPSVQTPPGQTPPPAPSRRLLLRTIRILLECVLVTEIPTDIRD